MKRYYFLLLVASALFSCEKQLNEKSNKSQFRPEKIRDVQSMLDYTPFTGNDSGAGEESADNYFVPNSVYNNFANQSKAVYTWAPAFCFTKNDRGDWGATYSKIYYCNIAMEALDKISYTSATAAEWNDVYGQAYFKRGQALWRATDIFTLPYDEATVESDMGLPLRLNSNFEERSVRSTLGETYRQIIADLKASIPRMKILSPHPIRPSRPAAYGLLSSIYLSMRNYTAAKLYADSALMLRPGLMDYNAVLATNPGNYSFSSNNVESMFMSIVNSGPLLITTARIDTFLYNSYDANDLRKKLYFRARPDGYYSFKGSYGNDQLFSGVASDEMYLTRAECLARAGNKDAALADLNKLLITRYNTNTYVPITATTAAEALQQILVERRKELVYRFVRWTDIRRLNKEGAGIVPKRLVNGQVYELPVNSPKYARPIPEEIIAMTGMKQNPQ